MIRTLAAILFAIVFVRIQQEISEPHETLFVTYTIDQERDNTVAIARRFLSQIAETIDPTVTIQFVTRGDDRDADMGSPAATLRFSRHVEGEEIPTGVTVSILPLDSELSELSPILDHGRAVQFNTTSRRAQNIALALLYYSVRRCDLAQPHFARIAHQAEVDPALFQAITYYRGNCALTKGQYEEAVAFYEPIIYDSAGAFRGTNLAWTYLRLGQEEAAFTLINEAITRYEGSRTLTEDLSTLYSQRAQLYALSLEYEHAITDMNTAVELSPANPALYVLRGQMILLTYEWDQVLADYNKALELDPDYADAYFFRGILFYTQGPRENALHDLESYLDREPHGLHAEEAARYLQAIRTELNALQNSG